MGINYWPARTAMGWWTDFDRSETLADFSRIAAAGFDSVRLFLLWEAFQPTPTSIDSAMLDRLVVVVDMAHQAGLGVMPTLFTGHMSGVNWIPPWALGKGDGDGRFRVVSGGSVSRRRPLDWYGDATIGEAQARLAGEAARALASHPALFAWDLGNENSNCVVPADRAHGLAWLERISGSIRVADSTAAITLGLHMEDLEQDRHLGPKEAATVCDFLTMHGYPGYCTWSAGPTDERLLPFLTRLTRHLGDGAEVLFSEFGVPTRGDDEVDDAAASPPRLVSEEAAATYVGRALPLLREAGATGAMLWCHSDYDRALWTLPPLDEATHERSFGLWRADGREKPAIGAIRAFQRTLATSTDGLTAQVPPDEAWLDVGPDEFYRSPERELPRLFGRYCAALGR